MKIALIGYGKMGKAIEDIALQRGHTISLKIDLDNAEALTKENLSLSDVAIEFSSPHSARENVMKLLEYGVPVVCGSTGWLDAYDEVKGFCTAVQGAFLYSSNYSVGVNIFFALNKKLAKLMSAQSAYQVQIEEIHHTQKKDAPSGTAITLAEQVIGEIPGKTNWVNHSSDNPGELVITSERIDPAPGTHKIKYSSAVDDIEIIHTAHNRQGFATGAVIAAEFLQDKKGIFGMNDVLGF
jgi:4-hydroxy-tetrahydrodipicolinate reductase